MCQKFLEKEAISILSNVQNQALFAPNIHLLLIQVFSLNPKWSLTNSENAAPLDQESLSDSCPPLERYFWKAAS